MSDTPLLERAREMERHFRKSDMAEADLVSEMIKALEDHRLSDGLLLDEAERRRFAMYLDREARSASVIAQQLANSGGPVVGPMLAKQERIYAAAATFIADRLRTTESFTVKGG